MELLLNVKKENMGIKDWWNNWRLLGVDFVTLVKEIEKLYNVQGWDILSPSEREIIIRCNLANKTERDEILTIGDQVPLIEEYYKSIMDCRKDRVIKLISILTLYLTDIDYTDIRLGVSFNSLYRYIQFGFTDLKSDIYDSLEGVVPLEGTIDELITKVEKVLQ
jgi:hypothetical protein